MAEQIPAGEKAKMAETEGSIKEERKKKKAIGKFLSFLFNGGIIIFAILACVLIVFISRLIGC